MNAAMISNSVSYGLVQAAKAHRSFVSAALSELGLFIGQDLLLFQLWEEEGLTHGDLAERLDVEPPAITKMLKRMEAAGWVERRQDASDARVSRVYLTEQGRALEHSVQEIWQHAEARMLEDFPAEEKMLLRRMLRSVRDNLTGT